MIPQAYFDKVKVYFNGDIDKTWAWFDKIHSALGSTPLNTIKIGQVEKAKRLIDRGQL